MNPSFEDTLIAHAAEDGRCHSLKEHLLCTAKRASEFASEFGAATEGYKYVFKF
ncbi:MAG: hypothetical protein HY880_03980 [Deltaproteobacteria bacterium]|nr:hypothetical protein [Deltaproteobacteria bacterium]